VRQTDGVRIAIDRDDPQPEFLRAKDRAPLVAPRADEEDGLHSRAMLQTGAD
jgi:hypothetical protein